VLAAPGEAAGGEAATAVRRGRGSTRSPRPVNRSRRPRRRVRYRPRAAPARPPGPGARAGSFRPLRPHRACYASHGNGGAVGGRANLSPACQDHARAQRAHRGAGAIHGSGIAGRVTSGRSAGLPDAPGRCSGPAAACARRAAAGVQLPRCPRSSPARTGARSDGGARGDGSVLAVVPQAQSPRTWVEGQAHTAPNAPPCFRRADTERHRGAAQGVGHPTRSAGIVKLTYMPFLSYKASVLALQGVPGSSTPRCAVRPPCASHYYNIGMAVPAGTTKGA
jgi:hypothetical protein